MAFEQGNLDFDKRKRCVKDHGNFQIIRYGMNANEMDEFWDDITGDYKQLSRGGRRPGNCIEDEHRRNQRHYFNKRIMTDEERQVSKSKHFTTQYGYGGVGHVIHSGGDAGSVSAQDGEGSASGTQEVEAAEGRVGSGDSNQGVD